MAGRIGGAARTDMRDSENIVCAQVLIVDDEAAIREVCARVAGVLGCNCVTAANGEEAVSKLTKRTFDIVLTDVRMPLRDGFDLLDYVKESAPDTAVVMMTGYGTIEQAVRAMRTGAADYITKPFELTDLKRILGDLIGWRRASRGSGASDIVQETANLHGIIGRTAAMRNVFDRIARAAAVDSTVLVQGESGTGKELVARAIHALSSRASEPFLPLDCGAMNENLVENELFGHEKDAFTGANRASPGVLRAAGSGTVFLDEIGELPASVQAKCLRALQEHEVRPVGGLKPEPYHARVIAATNRDLEEDALAGRFRKDLFYRLHVLPIYLPPLRDRRDDIPLLVKALMETLCKDMGRSLTITDDAMDALMNQNWPGNVRQLQNCIEQAFVMTTKDCITREVIDSLLSRRDAPSPESSGGPDQAVKSLAACEEEAIRKALQETGNNKTAAARALGISKPTLYAKLRKYNVAMPSHDNPSPSDRR